jgi:hypothetical protein
VLPPQKPAIITGFTGFRTFNVVSLSALAYSPFMAVIIPTVTPSSTMFLV